MNPTAGPSHSSAIAQLVYRSENHGDACYPLARFPVTIGRSDEADVSIEDRWLSRQHCEIDCRDGQLVVRDLGSRHGTFLNGLQVDESTLEVDDELRIGLTQFRLLEPGLSTGI